MITANELARALEKCPAYNDGWVHSDDNVRWCVDGWYDLDRAARLLNRLERMRARRDMKPFSSREEFEKWWSVDTGFEPEIVEVLELKVTSTPIRIKGRLSDPE